MRGAHEIDDLRMNGRLASGELDHLGIAFGADEIIQHRFHFFERQAEARLRICKAERTAHVAGAVHLDNPETRVLLVIGAEPAIVWAPSFNLASKGERNRPRL